jgi:transcriptional regulator with XRE-family HTH domain
MSTARLERKLTQKDVAQKINEKPSVVQDYESGKAIPNPQILGKLERILGVKLRGAFSLLLSAGLNHPYHISPHVGTDIGKKLTPPGKK